MSLGAVVSLFIALKLARQMNITRDIILDLFVWGLVGGFLGARIFFVALYAPEMLVSDPVEVFKIWHGGASSLGGFIGAFLAALIYFKAVKKMQKSQIAQYVDLMIFAFWPGWSIGRIGCFLIHDHVGRLSDFFLAVNFPYGARHDLGLYESMLACVIFLITIIFYKKLISKPGRILFVTALIYSVARFFLDFLRADDLLSSDARYGTLTPAQWGMAAVFLGLTFWFFYAKIRQRKNLPGEVA